MNHINVQKLKEIFPITRPMYAYVGVLFLSIILGICVLLLTVIPSDLYLIAVLLKDINILIMNTWPILLVMLLIYFISNRIWVSYLLTALIVFCIAEVNRFKIFYRDDPFVFADLLLVGEATNMISKYSLFLDKMTLLVIFILVCCAIMSALLFRPQKTSKYKRVIGVVSTILILGLSINHFYFKDTQIYNKTWHDEFGSQWKTGSQYASHGVIYSFIRSMPSAFILPPSNYNELDAKNAIGLYSEQEIPEEKKVHVISIMLEAYNDFSVFPNIEFITDPYENFHKLQADSYHGNLVTNIFAAGTIDTERAFLTGYGDPTLKDKKVESFVQYFGRQGYYLEAMHPCYGWFYNRKNINLNLGFDSFDSHENKYSLIDPATLKKDLYHNLIKDYDFYDYIIEGYEDAVAQGNRYFNFSVTYQNHGPYETYPLTQIPYLKNQEHYSYAEYNIINNYLKGIAESDEALAKLRAYVDAQEEPIVLILFGDHNPWLGEQNSVYDMLGIDIDLESIDGTLNYYSTPYVFYANEAAKTTLGKDFNEEGNSVSPMFLMPEFFEYVGLEGSAYMNYLIDLKKEYDVLNPVVIKKDGEYLFRNEEELDSKLIEQINVEYYMRNKFKFGEN